jgi:hypothetical protein
MAKKFMSGINNTPANTAKVLPPEKHSGNDDFLILILLFILLAASPSLGLDSRYFFMIIMAVIGTGGIGKAFGLSC